MNELYEKLKKQIAYWQKNGVPILFWRDEQKKAPSVSLTMMLISFILCILSLINKAAKVVEGVDVENSLQLFMVCAGLYFGRSFGKLKSSEEDKADKE
jgi:hypothetical protein